MKCIYSNKTRKVWTVSRNCSGAVEILQSVIFIDPNIDHLLRLHLFLQSNVSHEGQRRPAGLQVSVNKVHLIKVECEISG